MLNKRSFLKSTIFKTEVLKHPCIRSDKPRRIILTENKKGATGHFEMIIAFSIFLIFVSFTFLILKPQTQKSAVLKETIIQGIYNQFIESNSVGFTKIFLKENSSKNCFKLNVMDVFFDIPSGYNILVSNALDPLQPIEIDYSSPPELSVKSQKDNDDFYYIFLSEEFPVKSGDNCPHDLSSENYLLGSIETLEILSNKSLHDLENQYKKDYIAFKKSYNIPKKFDIAILSENYLFLEREIPDNVEVLAKAYNKDVLFEDGSIKSKNFKIMIW